MPPAVPLRSLLYHCCAVHVIGVSPLLAQLAEFNDTAASVVVGHPPGKLIGCDGGNEHSDGGVEARAVTTYMIPTLLAPVMRTPDRLPSDSAVSEQHQPKGAIRGVGAKHKWPLA